MLDAVFTARTGGLNRILCKAPTGTGKTVTFAAIPAWPALIEWLSPFPKNERKMLVIAHREELLDQAAAKILAQNPELRVDIEQADRYASRFSDVVIASIQTLAASKFRRMKRLLAQHTFRVVIVDEAHHAAADTYRTALAHLGFLPAGMSSDGTEIEAPKFDDVAKMRVALDGWDAKAPKDRLLIGVTATPNRSDAIGLGCVFQSIAYSYALKDAIDDGWLVPIVPWVVETATNLDGVKLSHGDFNQKQLADAVNNDIRNKLAVAGWLEHAADRSTIAFTVDVAHAHALAAEFCRQGIKARAVSGETPKEERRDTLRAFTAGEVQVITNCMVLTEGTDLPLTGCILHAKPTKSPTLYEQMTGRGLRIHPGKTDCILLDIVDIARRHSLQTAPVLYGLPPTLACNGVPLAQTADELEAWMEKHPGFNLDRPERFTLKQLEAMARTFDIWNIRPMGEFATGLVLTWTRMDDAAFSMSYPWLDGHERLEVKADILGRFDVTVQPRFKDPISGQPMHAEKRTIGAGVVTATEALKLAEAYVQAERSQVLKILDVDAPWKKRPASPKQLGLLKARGIPFDPKGLTMGQASALIDNANLRRS
jgi:ATP-dependent helicase IRC3